MQLSQRVEEKCSYKTSLIAGNSERIMAKTISSQAFIEIYLKVQRLLKGIVIPSKVHSSEWKWEALGKLR